MKTENLNRWLAKAKIESVINTLPNRKDRNSLLQTLNILAHFKELIPILLNYKTIEMEGILRNPFVFSSITLTPKQEKKYLTTIPSWVRLLLTVKWCSTVYLIQGTQLEILYIYYVSLLIYILIGFLKELIIYMFVFPKLLARLISDEISFPDLKIAAFLLCPQMAFHLALEAIGNYLVFHFQIRTLL